MNLISLGSAHDSSLMLLVMEKGIRGMARRQRSDFLRHVIEKVSLMSNSWGIPSSPDGSSQSKL
ncbi:hypothetical protein C4D60_Mb06t31430 [Musa balbisiana]|uniref:Uncharacterized protein n=1 Tax=Musa balbisiana TaxID=52838 RepID=A0A4S8IS67_MUSBA|nr:hypothetical protein C4D60_Mb06t31430 [Musa balbisiana]